MVPRQGNPSERYLQTILQKLYNNGNERTEGSYARTISYRSADAEPYLSYLPAFCTDGEQKTDPRGGLRLGALTVLRWLCGRLGEPLPGRLSSVPDPACYRELADDCLFSYHLNEGFVIDIVFIPEASWTLQITEPDLGSNLGGPHQARQAVPGRVIETNAAFRVEGDKLNCGFQINISDPCSCTEEAEVYRLAFVRQLIRDPDFGLRQGMPLSESADRVTTEEQVKTLVQCWRAAESQLPFVVFTQVAEGESPAQMPVPKIAASPWPVADAITYRKTGLPPQQKGKRKMQDPPYPIERFAQRGMTLCHSVLVEAPAHAALAELLKKSIAMGDIIILEPIAFGGQIIRYPYSSLRRYQEETLE